MTLYYFEGLTLAEIGECWRDPIRVCQIHTKAVGQLRLQLVRPVNRSAPACEPRPARVAPLGLGSLLRSFGLKRERHGVAGAGHSSGDGHLHGSFPCHRPDHHRIGSGTERIGIVPMLPVGTWAWPVTGPVMRVRPARHPVRGGPSRDRHRGPPGTPILATEAGTVTFAGGVGGELFVTVVHGGGLLSAYPWVRRRGAQG